MELACREVEVGLHGHHHVDHALLDGRLQNNEICKGLAQFESCGISVRGFRGPFLRFNDETNRAAVDNGLSWVSHTAMLFYQNICSSEIKKSMNARRVLDFYTQKPHELQPSVPFWEGKCLELPVSLPDDEILIDRLGISDPSRIAEIWLDMLAFSRREGELFNLLIHPERMDLVAEPLESLLKTAVSYGDIWIASLDEIARWWHERLESSFIEKDVEDKRTFKFYVPSDSQRCSFMLHKPGGSEEFLEINKNRNFSINGSLKPVVGLPPGYCEKGAPCLTNEGFLVEPKGDLPNCSHLLEGRCAGNRREIIESLKHTRGDILRIWRWPKRFKSALAVSADVDAITVLDFVRRAWHFHRFKRKTTESPDK